MKADPSFVMMAAEQFLGKTDAEVCAIAHEVLMGGARMTLGKMTVVELIQNFDRFAQGVQECCELQLKNFGLICLNFAIKEIKDDMGYLESLGREATAERKKIAQIECAKQEKEGLMATMETDIEVALLSRLKVDPNERTLILDRYEQAVPILEKALGETSPVFKDFLLRYAMILASGKDYLSIGKAEQLMTRANHIADNETSLSTSSS